MAAFFEQLWESIFTPGPTPTLLIATNASFAALQVLLFVMLLATYSIHFAILSVLCGGLWWSINWFAAEIRKAQWMEEEAKRIREARKRGEGDGHDGDEEGEDTEVGEEEAEMLKPTTVKERVPRPETQSTVFVQRPGEDSPPQQGASTGLEPPVQESVKRRKGMGESTGDLSTDSEWEKLSEEEGER